MAKAPSLKTFKMNLETEIEPHCMKSGIFQYFLLFDPPQKIKIHTPSIALNLHVRGRGKQTKIAGNFKIKPANLWQFKRNQAKATTKKIEQNAGSGSQKRVKFNDKPSIQHMHVWQFAYKQARKGEWEKTYSDKAHFQSRIDKLNETISPIFEKKLEKMNKYPLKPSNGYPKKNTCSRYYQIQK